jgi:hypothetical protein
MLSRRFLLTAALLGLLWLVVLHVPATTRQFIAGMGRGTAAALLCLTSIAVALSLRRFIPHREYDLWLSVVGPLYGALVFGYAAAVTTWVRNGFRALNYWDLFVLLPFWAVMVALWSALLVFPTAYLAQRLMRWAADAA